MAFLASNFLVLFLKPNRYSEAGVNQNPLLYLGMGFEPPRSSVNWNTVLTGIQC